MKTWIVVALLATFIVAKVMFTFALVGDLGPPDWDYRPVRDIPAESPYAAYETMPYPQHVRGAKGE
jgi:hypothetical protein